MASHIKLFRELMDKSFYKKDSERVHLWIHLLLRANWSEREENLGGKPILCKPGQFTTGRKQLSTETGISESKIERLLTYFEKIEQQIEQQKTTTNRLITILNWNKYQATEQQIKQRPNNDRTTGGQQPNTLKEDKEYKENIYIYSEFYDNELSQSNNDSNYKHFIEFLFGKNDVERPLKKILSMKDQLKFNEYQKLRTVASKNNTSIYQKLLGLENTPKKYNDLYLTLNNWLKNGH